MRVIANSPSLWPTMFSVTYTGMCCLPLWTAIVSPTKSGRIVERLDHVLIGRLSLEACAAFTFCMRCPSTNGPFLTERAIRYPLRLLVAAAHGRADAAPTVRARLADLAEVVLLVADFADRRAAVHVHAADLARAHAQLCVLALAREQLDTRARGARDLRALAGQHLDAVHR